MCSGKLSHDPSQPAVVPSPRSMFEPRPKHATRIMEFVWDKGKRFGNPRAMFDSSQIPHQGILHATNRSAAGGIPVQRSTGRPVAKGEEQIGSTIPTPRFARRPSTMFSFSPAGEHIHRITWLINKHFRSRNFNLTNSPHRQRFHVGRQDSKPRNVLVLIFHWMQCYGSRSGDG